MLIEYNLKADKQHFYNITSQVREAVAKSGVTGGLAIVYCPHTTAGITINENADPDVIHDMLLGLDRAFPNRVEFRHGEGNSSAHLKASCIGSSVAVIIEDTGIFKMDRRFYYLEDSHMEIYKNPNCKKIRGSHILEVTCAYCKCFIANYQKVGESNFVKMYNDRIIDGSIDFSQYHGAIFCPNCNERIATQYLTKMDKKEAYRLVPSAFHKKKV